MKTLKTLETTETTTVQQALQIANNSLSLFASSPDFNAKMQLAFGNHKIWSTPDLIDFPTIEIRPAAEINNARGAFAAATNTIYLSQELVDENSGNVGAIASVLLEEYGHYLDAQNNAIDSPGDEGELFANLVLGKGLSESELLALWGEDDSAIVVWDGEGVSIEQKTLWFFDLEPEPEVVNGTSEDDYIQPGQGDTVYGGAGNDGIDYARGTQGGEYVDGGDGDDTVGFATEGSITVDGGSGDDVLWGSNGNSKIDGQSGNDELNGAIGNDTLIGGAGYNTYYGAEGDDIYIVQATSGGSNQNLGGIIDDDGGIDQLILEGGTLSFTPTGDEIGLSPGNNYDLILDLNRDGVFDENYPGYQQVLDLEIANFDLQIANFFDDKENCKPGWGFIETVGNLSGQEILDYFCEQQNQPSISISDATAEEGKPLEFTISLSEPLENGDEPVKVTYTTQDNTATQPQDYYYISREIQFNPGEEKSQTVTVGSRSDTEKEGDEDFSVILSNPQNAELGKDKGVGTITQAPSISILNNPAATEGEGLEFIVILSKPSTETVTVAYTTEDITATQGNDYLGVNGRIQFNPGETNKTITIESLADTETESNETFWVKLFDQTNAELNPNDSQEYGTITGNVLPLISINDVTAKEGEPLKFLVTLSEFSPQRVTVNYRTEGGTADRYDDYNLETSSPIIFEPGEREKEILISTVKNGDKRKEDFLLNLFDPSNAEFADPQGIGNIEPQIAESVRKSPLQREEYNNSAFNNQVLALLFDVLSFLGGGRLKNIKSLLKTIPRLFNINGTYFTWLAIDPPDPNFTTIVEPVTPSVSQQPFTAADLGSQQLADAANALIDNQTEWIGVADALLTSLYRADGAKAAGDQFWENQQEQAAQQYSLALGALTDPQSQLWANFFNAYQAAGLPPLDVNVDDVINYQNELRANGLSPETVQTLTELGADSATQQEILDNLLAVDPNQVVALGGGSFPAAIVDPTFLSSISGAAEALDQGIIGGGFISGVVSITAPTPNVTGDGLLTGLAPNTSDGEQMMLTDGADTTLPTTAPGQQILALSGSDNLTGTETADNINGNQGADTINGAGGNDTLWGGKGSEQIDGGADNDLIYGNDDNDILNGGDGNDTLYGGKRRDILNGGAGDDILAGDAGQDILTGEVGNDTFVLADGEAAAISLQVADVITDFSAGDKIGLTDGLTFANLTLESISLSLNSAEPITATALKVGENYLGIVAGFVPESLTADAFVSV
ncbi:MAG: hypothetical protein KA714_08200 [Limnoraphis sp. WC205]|nr:hypothetical protein [Limnoraphis sp. WC205]